MKKHPVFDLFVTEDGRVFGPRKERKYGLDKHGYKRINFVHDGAMKTKFFHHLVCETYIGERPDGFVTNHKNGDKLDNRLENLEYVSISCNTKHAHENGLTSRSSPVVIDGTEYYSKREAARKLNSYWRKINSIIQDSL